MSDYNATAPHIVPKQKLWPHIHRIVPTRSACANVSVVVTRFYFNGHRFRCRFTERNHFSWIPEFPNPRIQIISWKIHYCAACRLRLKQNIAAAECENVFKSAICFRCCWPRIHTFWCANLKSFQNIVNRTESALYVAYLALTKHHQIWLSTTMSYAYILQITANILYGNNKTQHIISVKLHLSKLRSLRLEFWARARTSML